jgi:hypothetical protein
MRATYVFRTVRYFREYSLYGALLGSLTLCFLVVSDMNSRDQEQPER